MFLVNNGSFHQNVKGARTFFGKRNPCVLLVSQRSDLERQQRQHTRRAALAEAFVDVASKQSTLFIHEERTYARRTPGASNTKHPLPGHI